MDLGKALAGKWLLVILLSSMSLTAFSQDNGMPADSFDLLVKLRMFEQQEREKVEESIEQKRKQVVAVLKQQMERETKAGHLKPALEIRKAIATLEGRDPSEETEEKPETPSDTSEGMDFSIAGTIWKVEEGAFVGGTFEFLDDGRMKVTDPTVGTPYMGWSYRYEKDDLFIAPSGGKEMDTRLSRKNTKLEINGWGVLRREEAGN